MDKAIYGLAMPFNLYWREGQTTERKFVYELNKKENVELDSLIGVTLEHDYLQTLGKTDRNVTIKVNDIGIFFRLIPDTEEGMRVYRKVKRGLLRQCSCSYTYKRKVLRWDLSRDAQDRINTNDDIQIYEHKGMLLYECCLTNNPANKDTFCTVDKDHPLLKGIIWDEGKEAVV